MSRSPAMLKDFLIIGASAPPLLQQFANATWVGRTGVEWKGELPQTGPGRPGLLRNEGLEGIPEGSNGSSRPQVEARDTPGTLSTRRSRLVARTGKVGKGSRKGKRVFP